MRAYIASSEGPDGDRDLTVDDLRHHLAQLDLIGMPGNAVVQQTRIKGMKARLRRFTVSDALLRVDEESS